MDYYERTLYNSRLGTQDGEGMKGYFYPLASGAWKYYNTRYDSFWCCTGTGMEEFAKFGDSIYFHDDDGIYVNLLIASEVRWPEKALRLRQETDFPENETTTLTVRVQRPVELALNIRVPYLATKGGSVSLNGEPLPVFSNPSSYLTLRRVWKDGDRVEVNLPMTLHVDATPDDASVQALMYGPLVLAGELGNQGLTEQMMYLGSDPWLKAKPSVLPEISSPSSAPHAWVEPAHDSPYTFRTVGQSASTTLVPFYKLSGERYTVYWKVKSPMNQQG